MELLAKLRPYAHDSTTATPVDRKIRVLLVITCLGSGGATNVVLDIAHYFHQHPGFDIEVVTGPIPPDREDLTYIAVERNISVHIVPSLGNRISPAINLKAVGELRRIMQRGNYDIVHTHSSVAGVAGRIAARLARIPAIIHHVHGWGLRTDMPRTVRMLYLTLERLCARITSRLIVVCSPDIRKGLHYGIGNREQYTLIYNGIELEKFRQPIDETKVRKALGLRSDSKLVGMIGRLDEQKNPVDFIVAASMICKRSDAVQFLIMGDGNLRPQCEQLIRHLHLQDKVFLLGHRSDIAKILPILTVTAMSSLWEGLPLAFLEAMSASKPIVSNNVDGARDVVLDGETGFLVTPGKPEELAERILQILDDEALCLRMGQTAQQRSQNFSVGRMGSQLEKLYTELHATTRLQIDSSNRVGLSRQMGNQKSASIEEFTTHKSLT